MVIRLFMFFAFVSSIQCVVLNLTCDQIRGFIDGHNNRRKLLLQGSVQGQPIAAEMKYMIWDEELAVKAANWASEYRKFHNPDRTVGSKRFRSTGENLYWTAVTDRNYKIDPEEALEAWFIEYKDYAFGPVTTEQFSGPTQIGHYTQVVWSESVYVGCAISEFQKSWKKIMVGCNYGPAGNVVGQQPYKTINKSGGNVLICGTGNCDKLYGKCSK